MDNVINVTDKLVIKNLENKISRLETLVDIHIKNVENLRTGNFVLIAENDRLKQENDELKKHLRSLDIGVVYER